MTGSPSGAFPVDHADRSIHRAEGIVIALGLSALCWGVVGLVVVAAVRALSGG